MMEVDPEQKENNIIQKHTKHSNYIYSRDATQEEVNHEKMGKAVREEPGSSSSTPAQRPWENCT